MGALLADHPEASGFHDTGVPEDEGQHLQSVYPTASAMGGPGRFGFDRRAHLTEDSPLVSARSRRTLEAEWGRHWDVSKPLLVEKSPPNLMRGRFLQALFPDSCFVMVMRHPIAVSCATEGWTAAARGPGAKLRRGPLAWTKTGDLLRHWLVAHRALAGDRPFIRDLTVVRYEDLVERPARELSRIHRLLGVNDSEASLPVRGGINDAYFDRWERRRRHPLTRPYIARLIDRYEGAVNEFGYSLREPWTVPANG